MSFKPAGNFEACAFNDDISYHVLDAYRNKWVSDVRYNKSKPSHPTVAPSAFRCNRRIWFRLRNTKPNYKIPSDISQDMSSDFVANIGTACHRMIQIRMKELFGKDWIDVKSYLESINFDHPYELEPSEDNLETKIRLTDVPISMSVDGILRINGELYILEIKTSEYSTFSNLSQPKDEHIAQIRCYSAILGIHKILFMYQDRMYGDIKCYTYTVPEYQGRDVMDKISEIQKCVTLNIPPDRLPWTDKWCTTCPYNITCKEWG